MIAAVVLAAGRSTRLGLPKALLPAGAGETLLSRAVAVASASVDGPVIPVIGGDADLGLVELERINHPLQRPLQAVVNPRHAEGLSTSLQAGLRAAGTADGVLVLLADQPGVEEAQVSRLVERFRSRPAPLEAVAASQGSEQRTPVVLGRALFVAVARLTGDEGARRILRSRPDQVLRIDWGHGPWEIDIDTWEDYASFARRCGWHQEWAEGPAEPQADIARAWAAIAASGEPPVQKLARFRRAALAALNGPPPAPGA
jgi:molybdenum cofactor cytidylyltransferase